MPRKPTHQHDFSDRPLGYSRPDDRSYLPPAGTKLAHLLGVAPRPQYVMHKIGVRYNQGQEGACVGNAVAAWCSAYDYAHTAKGVQYDALYVYNEAKKIDEFPGENYSGTSVRAGLEVIRSLGAPRIAASHRLFITEYTWASGVEDILNHVALVGPVVCGLNWYTNFDIPVKHPFNGGRRQNFFIGEGDLGSVRGGHAIILCGYYRNRQGAEWVRFQNSWGFDYPLIWMPVSTLTNLFNQGTFEAGLITETTIRET